MVLTAEYRASLEDHGQFPQHGQTQNTCRIAENATRTVIKYSSVCIAFETDIMCIMLSEHYSVS